MKQNFSHVWNITAEYNVFTGASDILHGGIFKSPNKCVMPTNMQVCKVNFTIWVMQKSK